MTARHDQQEAERAIFLEFAETVPLPVRSIESRQPPEPDILCDIVDEGSLAFELGAVVNPAFERAINEQRKVRDQFRAAYNALLPDVRQRIETSLGGPPAVFVGFTSAVPPGR